MLTKTGFWQRGGGWEYHFFSKVSRLALGFIRPPIKMSTRPFSPGVATAGMWSCPITFIQHRVYEYVESCLPFPICLHGVCRDKFTILLYTINLTVFLLTSPRTSSGLLPTVRETPLTMTSDKAVTGLAFRNSRNAKRIRSINKTEVFWSTNCHFQLALRQFRRDVLVASICYTFCNFTCSPAADRWTGVRKWWRNKSISYGT